jgi:hypothetical protein
MFSDRLSEILKRHPLLARRALRVVVLRCGATLRFAKLNGAGFHPFLVAFPPGQGLVHLRQDLLVEAMAAIAPAERSRISEGTSSGLNSEQNLPSEG